VVVCATLAGVEGATDIKSLMLDRPIAGEKGLVVGQLENGLRYVILPNKLPPQRFEAHLEIHAGSVDEKEDEQGVAHLVEHVTFLGSKRRENLLGTGARANAYTDFHHTVFHVHAPVINGATGGPMLPQVLEALEEIAFHPEFLPTRIEKERKAVMAEAQMMNTIEYRVDCQLLQYLHEENNLGYRFPIGKMDQVKTWPHETLRTFWNKWYFPGNATLYVVGDLDRDSEATRQLIIKTFGKLPAAREALPAPAANGNGHGNGAAAEAPAPLKQRHDVRPPVVHKHGHGPLAPGERPAEVKMFRHPLLQHFMLTLFCKLPIQPMSRMAHLRQLLMIRIMLSVFQFRINGRYMDANPSFLGIELDISDSGREGCAVSTLTITSVPSKWREATAVGIQEVRRLQRHGLTQGEFERYRHAILRDSAQMAEQANKIPSVDTLNFVMESLACGHTVMGHKDAHDAMVEVAHTITLEEINALARSMLSFASDYSREGELLEDAAAHPDLYAYLGPTRTTSIVVCLPAYVDASGDSISGGAPSGRNTALLGAAGHLDADQIDLAQLEEENKAREEFEVPEGAIKFDLTPEEIGEALADTSLEVEATTDVELPSELLPDEEVEALQARMQPRFVPLGGEGAAGPANPPPDAFSGITQRRLSNGIRINYRHTDNESKACLLRVIANGGRASEKLGAAPDGFGAVVVGTRTMSEAGTVGKWQREQVEAFCVANLINCALEADEENIILDFHFATGEEGLKRVFQLTHLFLTQPRWDELAMERAKQAFLTSTKSIQKSLERATAERIITSMLGSTERRFRDPTQEEVEALTLEGMRGAVMSLFHTHNLEVNIVGDFDENELESVLLKYLGTVPPPPPTLVAPILHYPSVFLNPPMETRHSTWHLQDSDERACAYIAGQAPCRWGPFGTNEPLGPHPDGDKFVPPPLIVPASAPADEKQRLTALRRRHPLYASCTLMLLTEIINSRLFTTVRDSLGLTYDVSFEVTMFDRVRTAWFSVHVTSHPDKIYEALNASVQVLREIGSPPGINRRELNRAKTTLLTRHESDLKDNVYWLGLMTHSQNDQVPHKTVLCLRDLKAVWEAATVEDIYDCYNNFNFSDENIFTCVGTSGKTAPPVPERILSPMAASLESDEDEWGLPPPGTGPNGQPLPNPMALFTAMMAAAQAMKLQGAVKQVKEGQQQQQQEGSQQQQQQ